MDISAVGPIMVREVVEEARLPTLISDLAAIRCEPFASSKGGKPASRRRLIATATDKSRTAL